MRPKSAIRVPFIHTLLKFCLVTSWAISRLPTPLILPAPLLMLVLLSLSGSDAWAHLNDSNCGFKKSNSEWILYGFKLPPGTKLGIPEGTYRYTFDGHDNYEGQEPCRVIIDARNTNACGPAIFEVLFQGRSSSSWGRPKPGDSWWEDFSDLEPPFYYASPHLLRPGLTIKSVPGKNGIFLPYDEEYKIFGESLERISSYEHFLPVFPWSWQKIGCFELKLVDQSPLSTDPYPGLNFPNTPY